MHAGTLTMEFDGEVINFSIYNSKSFPSDVAPLYRVDVVKPPTKGFGKENIKKKVKYKSLKPVLGKLIKDEDTGQAKLQFKTIKELKKYAYGSVRKRFQKGDIDKVNLDVPEYEN